MIINSLVNTFKTLVSKPTLFLPVLVSIFFGKVLTQLTVPAWIPIADIFTIWGSSTESPFLALVLSNPLEIGIILTAAIIGLAVSIIALNFLARVVKEQGIIEAVNDAVMDWSKALAVSFTLALAIVIFITAGIFIVELGAVNELLSFILLAALYIIYFFIFIKMIFIFPAMVEERKTKDAMHTSWNFITSYTGFGKALVFFILISFIIIIIDFFTMSVTTTLLIAEINDPLIIENIIPVIEDMVITSFAGVAIASYYFNKK